MESELEYIIRHSTSADAVLDSVERWAALHTPQPQMVCGPYEGRLLTVLCRSLHARYVVEVGTFVGYSTICLARGMAQCGTLHTFEVNEELESQIMRHLRMAGVEERVRLHIGDAQQLLPGIVDESVPSVDLAFIDADKRGTEVYYEMLVPRMRKGGLIVIDNMLWGRKVMDTERNHDRDTLMIDRFNEKVQNDDRVENVMVGVRDGLMICSVL